MAPAAHAADRSATPSTLSSVLSAAQPGDRILLASGDYGTFKGAAKTGTVTLTPAAGASASLSLSFAGATNLVIDGVTVRGGTMTGSTRNITIRNSAFTGPTTIDGLANSNVLFDRDTFNNINAGGQYSSPARIHLSYSSGTHSGVTIQNSVMNGGSADGVQSGVGVNIVNNEFTNIREGTCSACHTDAIQLIGAPGSLVQGNWLHNNQDGITAFDGLSNATIVDNAIGPQQSDPDCIDMYALKNSLIAHNSCTSGMDIWLDHKDADPASTGNTIRDNFAPRGLAGRDMASNTRINNLTNPTYQGGTAPGSFAGFKLAAGSAGLGSATDGGDVGVRFGASPSPTPTPTPTPTPSPTPTPTPTPVATQAIWTVPSNVRVGQTVTLDGTRSTGTAPLSCTWSFEDQSGATIWETISGCKIDKAFKVADTKYVKLIVRSANGTTASSKQSFPVSP